VATDARDTFGGLADMTGVTYYGTAGWYIELTLTGLDPANRYTFATSASRAKANSEGTPGYDDRDSLYTLIGADSASNGSTAGVTEISPTEVQMNTGNNHANGYVARWTDIAPGADGTIVIRAEAAASAPEGRKAYGFDVFMLQEHIPAVCGDGVVAGAELCDDGNTVDGDCCSATCSFEAAASACDDGDACTDVDACDGAGVCVAGSPLACDDGAFCNGSESCDSLLGCQPGTPPVVDDGVACTDDSCDEASDTVINTPNDGNCDNGLFCDGGETCDAVLDCQAGTPPSSNDGLFCTDDSCDEGTDSIVNVPDDAKCNDFDPCTADSCDAVTGCAFDPIIGCVDTDGDGVADSEDNCPNVPNANQADSNGNGVGDACETILVPATPAAGLLLVALLLALAAGLMLHIGPGRSAP
jgi:cysteine-rich repeat protein